MEYLDLRDKLTDNEADSSLSKYCEQGDGSCCEESPYILEADIDHIVKAVRNGEVQIDMIKNIYIHQQLFSSTDKCVFLYEINGRSMCSIYNFRPLICIGNTFGSPPRNTSDTIKISQGMQIAPYNLNDSPTCGLCSSCYKKARLDNPEIPQEEVQLTINLSSLQLSEMVKKGVITPSMSMEQISAAFQDYFKTNDIPKLILQKLGIINDQGDFIE